MGNQIMQSLIRNSNWKYDFGEIRADYSLGYARRALGESWVKLFNEFEFEFEFDFEFVKIFSCSIKTRFYEAGDLLNRR